MSMLTPIAPRAALRRFFPQWLPLLTLLALPALLAGCPNPTKPRMADQQQIDANAAILKDPKASDDVRKGAREALAKIGEPAIPALLGVFREGSRRGFEDAAYALGKIGPEAIPELIKALSDDEQKVRGGAAASLSGFGPRAQSATAELTRVLENDPIPAVRCAAAMSLGAIGPGARAAAPALAGAMRHTDPGVRQYAGAALRSVDPAAYRAAAAQIGSGASKAPYLPGLSVPPPLPARR